jgi:hypothetical protein
MAPERAPNFVPLSCHSDCHGKVSKLDAGGTLAAMRQLLKAAPDRRVTITRRFDGTDGSGVLEMTWKGTFACFSAPTTTGTIVVFDTRDAKLVRQRLYYG